jgi:Proline racemase
MDVVKSLSHSDRHAISCVEMHTTGEPVRIIYDGYPELSGTLMKQRAKAKLHHDTIRRRLMFEPRGHNEMLAISPLKNAARPFISPIPHFFIGVSSSLLNCRAGTVPFFVLPQSWWQLAKHILASSSVMARAILQCADMQLSLLGGFWSTHMT